MTDSDQIEHARELRRAGEIEKGKLLLLNLAGREVLDSMIELAFWELDSGHRESSDQWIERAEQCLRADDWDGHVSLHHAYDMGLGAGDREHQQKRARCHLEKVAHAGNEVAQLELALNFLHGLNGYPRSQSEFEKWIGRAIEQGSLDANCVYAEFLLRGGFQVPSEVLAELQRRGRTYLRAKKLLAAVEAQKK